MSPKVPKATRRRRSWYGLLGLVVLATSLAIGAGADAGAAPAHHVPSPKPTIVLVHGAWADASGWTGVTQRLQRQGYTVIAPANPLRGLASDADYLRSVLATIDGPIVLVGHSYGGMVLTNTATGNPEVKALVYIAAFAPDLGDTVGGLNAMNPGSQLGPDALVFRPFPGGVDAYIAPGAFRSAFASDLPRRTTDTMATAQRPIAANVLGEPSGDPAWATIPSWYLVATEDNAIPPATQRFMAQRAGAVTREVPASHVAMISQPEAATDLIRQAARTAG
jgi:pimeloyl-ACP methyl ester carboxylesterase